MKHAWWSHRLGRHVRVIASKTGVRPALRTRHGQVSPRSTFLRFAGFKWFAGRR